MGISQKGGGTQIVSYIHRLGPFLGVQHLEFRISIFGGGGQKKMNIFEGIKIL